MRPRLTYATARAALLALLLGAASASSAPLEVARPGAKAGPEAERSLDRALYQRVADAHRGASPRRVRQLALQIRRTPVSLDPAVLPATLPLLPATDASQRAEQAVIDEGIARTRTAKELYVYLERQTSVLRGSARPEDRELAGKLVRYLAGYKESWARAWLDELYARPAAGKVKVPVRFASQGQAKNVGVPLPLLPATQATEADVQRVIDAGIAATRETPTPKALFVYLEGQVHELRARGERPLAKKLTSYLGRYRKQWTASWLDPAGGRAQVRAEVKSAGSLLARLADESLLRRMPETAVLVSPYYSVSGVLATEGKRRTINILPKGGEGTTRDTLHELGHLAEDADLKTFAKVQGGVLRERAFGSGPQPLSSLLPGTSYGADQRGLAGGFLEPYVGRYYPKGWTEVLSMGLERLARPSTALDFFKADGWHCLVTLSALRR